MWIVGLNALIDWLLEEFLCYFSVTKQRRQLQTSVPLMLRNCQTTLDKSKKSAGLDEIMDFFVGHFILQTVHIPEYCSAPFRTLFKFLIISLLFEVLVLTRPEKKRKEVKQLFAKT